MYPPLLAAALGSLCVGAVATTRVRGSAAGGGLPPCRRNDSGALALAFPDAGGVSRGAGGCGCGGFAAPVRVWPSGGNTTGGPPAWPDLALTSTGASSRGTIFSVPSPADIRSGTLALPSDGAGTILVGPASALMIGGSPLRGVPT